MERHFSREASAALIAFTLMLFGASSIFEQPVRIQDEEARKAAVQKAQPAHPPIARLVSAIAEITDSATRLREMVSNVNAATQEQAQSIVQIADGLLQMENVTQQTAPAPMKVLRQAASSTMRRMPYGKSLSNEIDSGRTISAQITPAPHSCRLRTCSRLDRGQRCAPGGQASFAQCCREFVTLH